MGERAAGLSPVMTTTDGNGVRAESPRDATRQLEAEVRALREELGALVNELDRRRHEALDIKLQVRRHGLEMALTGVALLGAAAGFVSISIWRARKRKRLLSRVSRVGQAVARVIDRPERVATESSVPAKIATAAVNAAIAALIKKGLERMVLGARERQRLAVPPATHPTRLARQEPSLPAA